MIAKSGLLTLAGALVWLGVAMAIYIVGMRALCVLFERRRENLLLVATGR